MAKKRLRDHAKHVKIEFVPKTLVAGEEGIAEVTLKNDGESTWNRSYFLRPAPRTSSALWKESGSPPSVRLTRQVKPGARHTFKVRVLANRAGKRSFGARLAWNRVSFNDSTRTKRVTVKPKPTPKKKP